MIGGMVEVQEEGRYLSKHRGFLKVSEDDEEIGRLPFDQIEAMIVSAQSATMSKNLLTELAGRGSVTVLTNKSYEPAAIVLPIRHAAETIGHPEDQIAASKPQKKRLWQQFVQRKILHQAYALRTMGDAPAKHKRLETLAASVKSGDPDNHEAQAARTYFTAFFGEKFTRSNESHPINARLNYGYAILRAQCARAICAAGLHPAFGLHHVSRRNPLCLADDLIELFRPLIDMITRQKALEGDMPEQLTPECKRALAKVLQADMVMNEEIKPVSTAINQTAIALAKAFRDKSMSIDLPCLEAQPKLPIA